MIDTNLWFMFPVAVGIATIAMLAGIGGTVMFAPFFMFVLRLDPIIALGAGLAIEVFGFSSGVIGYLRKKAINLISFIRPQIDPNAHYYLEVLENSIVQAKSQLTNSEFYV